MKLAVTPLVLSTATFGLMLGVPQNAQASGLIRNVTPTTNFTGVTVGSLAATTNGTGLPGNKPSLTGDHAVTASSNSWRSALNSTFPISSLTIEFAFNRIYNLAGFSFWNTGGDPTFALQGIQGVKIEYKLGGGAWTALTGTGVPNSFLKGPNSGNVTPEQISFTPVLATNVRFSNMTNQGAIGGNNRIGFNEIQFRSIPEPSSTLALLALGLAGVGLKKRI